MENKSAEEVLKDTMHKYFSPNTSIGDVFSKSLTTPVDTYRCLIQTMKEYAQQEAVEFAEWKEEKTKLKYSEEYDGYVYMVDGVKKPVLDLSQLYQQFLTDKNK